MLEWWRVEAGYAPDAAARRLDVSPERLRAWEAGTSLPTVPQLRRLAHLYRRPLAAFYLPEPPSAFTVPRDFRRLPGQPPAPHSPELLLGLRLAVYRRAVALELEPDAPSTELVGSAGHGQRADELAERGRALLGVTLDEQKAWRDEYAALNAWKNALELHGVLVFHFSGVAITEVRGFSFSEQVLPVIGLNGSDSPKGRIFTLIHELGHLLLGEGGSCDLADYTRPRTDLADEAEVFCNRFAGSLLVPAATLSADPSVRQATQTTQWTDAELDRLARQFWVSREVILRRLLILGRADETFYRERRAELLALPPRVTSGRTGRPSVPVMVVRDVGKPFARLVLDAYHAALITGSDVSDYLGVRLKHLPKIEQRLSGPDLLTGGEP
jgi:Zn-dependent peptidase ImmA (M78 family)/transcriptional regulator with XRE-family HTH domain